jgi:hypothetical protein
MKTLGVLLLFAAAVYGLVSALDQPQGFVRVTPTVSRPVALETNDAVPPRTFQASQRSALEQVDPGAMDRAIAIQALGGRP